VLIGQGHHEVIKATWARMVARFTMDQSRLHPESQAAHDLKLQNLTTLDQFGAAVVNPLKMP
jgi:hypothetical protein